MMRGRLSAFALTQRAPSLATVKEVTTVKKDEGILKALAEPSSPPV